MVETAALLADEVLPERPLRQWVLSLPPALRFLPKIIAKILAHLEKSAPDRYQVRAAAWWRWMSCRLTS